MRAWRPKIGSASCRNVAVCLLLCISALCVSSCAQEDSSPHSQLEKTTVNYNKGEPDGERTAAPTPDESGKALGGLSDYLPQRNGYCIQIRSVASEEEAARLKAEIEQLVEQPVVIFTAALGVKGTWFRICVGNWERLEDATAAATRWTSSSGLLVSFMTVSKKGEADYLIKQIGRMAPAFRLPKAQEEALKKHHPSEGRPVFFARTPNDTGPVGVMQGPTKADGSCELIVIGQDGAPMEQRGNLAPDCPSCDLALKKRVRRCPTVLMVGDVGPWPGEEILLIENATEAESILVVLAQGPKGVLERRTAFWLDTFSDDLYLSSQASIETFQEGQPLLSFLRTEASLVGGRLCGLKQYSEFWQLLDEDRWGVHISKNWVLDEHYSQLAEMIRTLDQRSAFDEASELCADGAKEKRMPEASTVCLERAKRLQSEGRLLDALNASALLALSSVHHREQSLQLFQSVLAQAQKGLVLHAKPAACFDAKLSEGPFSMVNAKRSLENAIMQKHADGRLLAQSVGALKNAVFSIPREAITADSQTIIDGWFALLKTIYPARVSEIEALLTQSQLGEK